VPEIEMPGHAMAALSAYPQYSCTGGPFEVAKKWGVFEDVFCPKEETFVFLEQVLSEVMDLFPSTYIHIGGDECPKERWKSCAHCQSLMKKEGLKDEHELQSYFIRRIEKFVNSRGRKIIGWDEILEGGLAPNAAVMSWRGTEGGIAAAKQKHQVVMTPGSHCYFDHYQGDPSNEPVAIGGFTTLQKVYAYEPVPAELNDEEAKYVLGAQGNLWTEYMYSYQHVEYMAMPRMLAFSEVLWTPKSQRNEQDFIRRLTTQFALLDRFKVNYAKSMFKVVVNAMAQNGKLFLQLDALKGFGQIKFEIREIFEDKHSAIPATQEYKKPIEVNRDMRLRCWLEDSTGKVFPSVEKRFFTGVSTAKAVSFFEGPSPHYPGKGGATLVDGEFGSLPRVNAQWLAWSGTDMVATIDLFTKQTIRTLRMGYLHDEHNWIYAPKEIRLYVSEDGHKYKLIQSISGDKVRNHPREVNLSFTPQEVRWVKIHAVNAGLIPKGKPGEGKKSWLFFDEIILK
jgi:hexosaminidase